MAVIHDGTDEAVADLLQEAKDNNTFVANVEYELGADRDGFRTAWITLVVRDDVLPPTDELGRVDEGALSANPLFRLITDLERRVRSVGYIGRVHFRTEAEQEQVDADRASRST